MLIKKQIDYKVSGGKLIRIDALIDEANHKIIKDIKITGDFFIIPESAIFEIEKLIEGKKLKEKEFSALIKTLKEFTKKNNIQLIGFCIEDIINALRDLSKKQSANVL
jgi:lipoate-protein ligase A